MEVILFDCVRDQSLFHKASWRSLEFLRG